MAIDFTVIQAVRQRFGDLNMGFESTDELELQAPFVGKSKDFPFSCPNVAQEEWAVLQFESLGVTAPLQNSSFPPRNILQINNADIFGGLTSGAPRFWKTHSLLVQPGVLRENNVLHIESVLLGHTHFEHWDNFIIDNIVVWFKNFDVNSPFPKG